MTQQTISLCRNCQQQLPNGAKFCASCGGSQTPAPVTPARPLVITQRVELTWSSAFKIAAAFAVMGLAFGLLVLFIQA